jgi:hypothetical protein
MTGERHPTELSSSPDALFQETCHLLRLYVHHHPHAADTEDGIAQWWLADAATRRYDAALPRALQQLANEGLLDSRLLPSSRRLWFAVPHDGDDKLVEQ